MKSSPNRFIVVLILLCAVFVLYKALRPASHERSRSTPTSAFPRGERNSRSGAGQRRTPNERTTETSCQAVGVTCASQYFAAWQWPQDGSCVQGVRNGYPVPDPRCTPGGVVPNLTADTLRDAGWRTKCIRNCQSSEKQKHVTYTWYSMTAPADNNGQNQVCELDHLVPLELGGADGLGNIWPQCGPDETALKSRFFKRKDVVENYLAAKVRSGAMPLEDAQRGIAADWTQYLDAAMSYRGARSN